MPQISQVHIDVALTELSIMYMNEELIGDTVAPVLPVQKRSDKYFVYSKDAFLRSSGADANGKPKSIRRPGTEAATVDFSLSTDNYYAEELSLKSLVTDAELAYADNPLQPDIDATYLVTERIKLDNEVAVAQMVGNLGNYPTAGKVVLTTGGTGTSWAQYASANSHPFSDIKNGKVYVKKNIQREANTMMLTIDVARTLADHPDYKDQYKYTNPDGLTLAGLVKNVRGLDIVEGAQQQSNNAEGTAFSGGNVWVDSTGYNMALIYYRSSNVGPRSVHSFRTFEAPDDTTGVRGFNVRRYRWEILKGQFIEGSVLRTWKAIAVDGAGKINGAYAISHADA